MKYVIDFYKSLNKLQLFKTKEMHNIIVGCFFIFALCLNLFNKIDGLLMAIVLTCIGIARLLIIHVHNMNVGIFDKYQDGKVSENISSYGRMAILNLLVTAEIFLWWCKFHYLFLFCLLAFIPTVHILFVCLDKYVLKHINDNVKPLGNVIRESVDNIEKIAQDKIQKVKENLNSNTKEENKEDNKC